MKLNVGDRDRIQIAKLKAVGIDSLKFQIEKFPEPNLSDLTKIKTVQSLEKRVAAIA